MTAEVKHTPGPWFAHGRYIGTKNHASAIGECRDVNGNWSNDAPASANARLIAAAPDLLEALEGLLADIEEYQRINNLGGENNHWQVISRAAIAKAKGRS